MTVQRDYNLMSPGNIATFLGGFDQNKLSFDRLSPLFGNFRPIDYLENRQLTKYVEKSTLSLLNVLQTDGDGPVAQLVRALVCSAGKRSRVSFEKRQGSVPGTWFLSSLLFPFTQI